MNDKVVLSYHDISLYQSDITILENSEWLNDNIISFYYE